MKIVKDNPPNFMAIYRVFPHISRGGIIFAYGDTIFNPSGNPIPDQLLAHEEVHGERQRDIGVEEWWRQYLGSTAFRQDEEVLAHRVEYRALVAMEGNHRMARRRNIKVVSARLAAPLYRLGISAADAKALIQQEG